MKFGVSLFATDYSIRPAEAAKAAEEVGIESIFFPEHTHIPTNTVFPIGPEVPRHYKSTFDPFVAMSSAAAVTERINLGTGIALIPQRDPFTLAKEVATLDVISNGRVLLGIGAGWNEPETRNHGTDFNHRFKVMRERVEAMKRLWTEEEAEYHGDTVDFGPTWSYPKPVQKPHPPVIIGGAGPTTVRRVAAYGDGWMPIAFQFPFDTLVEQINQLNELCDAAGRARAEVTLFGVPLDPEGIEKYRAIGVARAVWGLDQDDPATARKQIADYGKAIEAYRAAAK